MNIIISHDVDHITAWEHLKSLILPKLIARALIERMTGFISWPEFGSRIGDVFRNSLHNIEDLLTFDREREIPSTFFIAVRRGRSLNYTARDAEHWIRRILETGFDVGVHGIAFDDRAEIKKEYDFFHERSRIDAFGIRIHYLSLTDRTLDYLSEAGYRYDSSVFALKEPYRTGHFWEFPLHLMDSEVFHAGSSRQKRTLEQAQDYTRDRLEQLERRGIRFASILFHDVYFSAGYRSWKKWYAWLIDWCRQKGHSFISYQAAVSELEKSLA